MPRRAQILNKWHKDIVCNNCGATIRIIEDCIYSRKNLSFYASCRCGKRTEIVLNELPRLIAISIAKKCGVLKAWKDDNHAKNCAAFWNAMGNP